MPGPGWADLASPIMTSPSHALSVASARTPEQKKSWWRTVLGRYPTGVSIITSLDAAGEPIGMVVGTFTSVSQDPPLVGFLPMVTSGTWRQIKADGRFCVSVLGAGHEGLCRRFFAGAVEDRFAGDEWATDQRGLPRLRSAVAWFDCDIAEVHPAGDHEFVLGSVRELGLGDEADGALPLLFLNGGYGSFTVPALDFDVRGFGDRLRYADALRKAVQQLADELDVEGVLTTVAGDQVAILTAANLRSPLVGVTFPFAAPMAPVFAAWAPRERMTVWSENARHLLGGVDKDFIDALVERVRRSGFAASVGKAMSETFDAIVGSPETSRSHLAQLWAQVETESRALHESGAPEQVVSSVQFPVFGPDGYADLELVISGFGQPVPPQRYREILTAAAARSLEMTALIGGHPPDDYPVDPGHQPLP